ncbi:MAG: nucleoside hydrolase [Peptoniphilaceae bacterium]|nr:nucleoside hydrolase [Peptoniphilaceae bacterium]MDD7383072.1 nucleoside hydrolase [Peptoniphilaceae bacterium]MDY3737508.1 nucleoside hydrolase [Peptoniphilaceae bacterium]
MSEKNFSLIIENNFTPDDALALQLALNMDSFTLLAVTGVSSKNSAEYAAENSLGLIRENGLYIDVLKGEDKNLDGQKIIINENKKNIFEADDDYIDKNILNEIYSMASLEGLLDILCFGPTTNLAKALMNDENLANKINRVFISGGTFSKGNVTKNAEFNFFTDPKSIDFILKQNFETYILPIDVSETVFMSEKLFNKLKNKDEKVDKILSMFKNEKVSSLSSTLLFYMYLKPEAFIFEELAFSVNIKENRGSISKKTSNKKKYVANRVNQESFYKFLEENLK